MLNSFFDKFIFMNSIRYKHNNFFLVNLPFVILPTHVLAGIAEKHDKDLNREIYFAIKDSVKGSLKKDFKVDFGVEGEKGLAFMETFFTASGWGKLERNDLDFDKKRAMVVVTDSPVAAMCKKAKAPVDTFIRGFLAGIFSIYFKKDVDCVEVKCSALGDQKCEFVIKELSEFNFKNKMTRDQLQIKQ